MAATEDELAKQKVQEAVWQWTGRFIVLGESDMSAEEAVLSHLQIHFKAPERFSSIALKAAGENAAPIIK